MKERICLVEDDPTIRQFVGKKLEREGYEITSFDSAEPVLACSRKNWDLYILDILLRGSVTGTELCRTLRTNAPTLPILILSALSEPSDRIEGLRSGADDYLTKPFEMEELLLRVRGMLRRRAWYKDLPQSTCSWEQNFVDFRSFEARHGSHEFKLSQKECMLMKLFLEKENEVVSREEILDRVWGYDAFPSTRTVDNFILRLRKYFEKTPSQPKYFISVRGKGYKFTRKEEI